MLVIVASTHDETAQALATRWAVYDATLLTCADLSVSGWRHYLNPDRTSMAMLGGRTVAMKEIIAVLIRSPGVRPEELVHIVPEDRAYVAAEMTAFLVSWLTELRCPVLNRPTAASLLGPGWRPEQWVYEAARLGIPVRQLQKHLKRGDQPPSSNQRLLDLQYTRVTVVGERWFGTANLGLAQQARRLADAAGVDLLAAYFTGPEQDAALIGADFSLDLTDEAVVDSVLDYLLRKAL